LHDADDHLLCRRCKLVVIKGAAHAPNVTHPKPFNAALREFLGKHA